jgi:hypothetical protein
MCREYFAASSACRPLILPVSRCCVVVLTTLLAGCGPSSQDLYDEALRQVRREQERLDSLRPAYDAARQTAIETVVKEITGTTPQESAQSTLQQLDAIAASAGNKREGEVPQDEIDRAIGQLTAMQDAIQSAQGVLSPGAKANQVVTQIRTPGTPEFKRFEEVLAAMPEVQAYERQRKRLREASQAALDAEAKLPRGGN